MRPRREIRERERDMRLSAPRISKAIAALALIAVASLIAVSLLADVRGASAQVENRPPVVSNDVDRETRGTGDDAAQVPVIELSSISEDRQHESDPNADDVKVIHDFTGYFSDPDNQTLSYSLRGAPSGVFRLVTGTAKLIQVGDIEYDNIDADDPDNVHTPGVDANGDFDFSDDGDTQLVLQYVFSVVATDGSAEALIEVTLPITEGEIVDWTEGLEFNAAENNPAGYAVGKVIIQEYRTSTTLTSGYDLINDGSQNPLIPTGRVDVNGRPLMARLFKIDDDGDLTIPVAGALDYETKDTYILVVEAGPARQSDKTIGVVTVNVTDVNEAPVFGASFDDEGDFETPASALTYIARLYEGADLGDVVFVHDGANHETQGDPVRAADQDAGQTATLAYSLVDGANTAFTGPFAINKNAAGRPVIRVTGALDADVKASYSLFIRVTDSGGLSDDAPLTITVRGVNENITPTPTRTAATPTPTRTPRAAATPTPTTTPARGNQDVLHRVGALEQLLATLQTLIQSLQGVIAAQDSRIAAQDDKIAAQDGRIAALESQIATAATITPTPPPTATPSPTPTATPEPTAAAASACVQTIGAGSVSGSWTSACLTANPTHGNTYYARFYTFTLDAAANVTIALTSDKPPYLYLLAGAGASGDVLRQAGGNNQTSVAITATLQAGSYTIEASTWQPKTIGDFTLTLTARQ